MQVREYTAAGGVVLDDAGRVLLIERWVLRGGELRHEIRLPKGHVEPGETDARGCAARDVRGDRLLRSGDHRGPGRDAHRVDE